MVLQIIKLYNNFDLRLRQGYKYTTTTGYASGVDADTTLGNNILLVTYQ